MVRTTAQYSIPILPLTAAEAEEAEAGRRSTGDGNGDEAFVWNLHETLLIPLVD